MSVYNLLFSLRTERQIQPGAGGQMFTDAHEAEIKIRILAKNATKHQEIQSHIIKNQRVNIRRVWLIHRH